MPTTRRNFLKHSAASLAVGSLATIALGAQPSSKPAAAAPKPDSKPDSKPDAKPMTKPAAKPTNPAPQSLSVLILGGTGFLGPAFTDALLARGHKVTLFNRGMREAKRREANRPSQVPDGVNVLFGNRDPEKTADDWRSADGESKTRPESPKGLHELEGKTFDAVMDTSGYYPRHVKASAELLAKSVKHYIFISTVSV